MLTCGACGAANPAGSRFCAACGTPLGLTCPSCGSPVEEGQRFCRRCGAALDAGVPAAGPSRGVAVGPDASAAGATEPEQPPEPATLLPVAERRVCSVLFVDLVGFTPLAESRDPEEVRELLTSYFDSTRTVIARYGGLVEKFIGDAVVAVWGAPTATEADAERAVRAGLDVLAAVAELGEQVSMPELRARAGIVTGETAVTIGATGQGLLAGDTVNTAARVQSVAEPGRLWVDEATYRLARAAIGFADEGHHSLKGKTGTTRLWAATRVLSGIGGIQRVDGLEAPMVGRDPELRAVRELFHSAVDRRRPRLVVVSGPAGVGKSRLGWEFEKYTDGLAAEVFWHRGRCLSYGDGVAFWALAEIVRQRLDIAEDDPREVAAAKAADALAGWFEDEGTRSYVALRLGRLLGAPTPDDKGEPLAQDELFAGWRVFFERLAAIRPVVILIEDAEHADPGLLDFLDHLVDWARDVPVFVLVLARPELEQLHPGWGTGRNRSTLTLDPLHVDAMDTLVDALVPGMPERARRAIVAQSQGLPLFAVETVRALVDRDVVVPQEGVYRLVGDIGRLTVPDSLHALLAARLDGLDPGLREVVADASVLGSTFAPEAVVAVSARPDDQVRHDVQELLRREVLAVSADPLSPQRGSYRFAQDLLRQVAYDTMSRRDRKRRHLAAADYLCTQWCDEGEQVADVVARHLLDAVAAVPTDPDVDELRGDAVRWLVRAADRALSQGAPRTAATSFVTAVELLEPGASAPDELEEVAGLLQRAAEARLAASDRDECVALVDRAVALYTAAGEARCAAAVQVVAARALQWDGRFTEANERIDTALDVLSAEPGPDTVRALSMRAALVAFGTEGEAVRLAEEALVLGQELDVDRGQLAELFIGRGIAAHMANRSAEAVSDLEHAVHLAELGGYSSIQARGLLNLSNVYGDIDFAESVRTAQLGCDVARRVGEPEVLAYCVGNMVMAQLFLGDWEGAARTVRTALEDDGLGSDMMLANAAMVAALRGEADEAERLAELPKMRRSEDAQDLGLALMIDATVAVARDHPLTALDAARGVLRYAPVMGLRHEAIRWAWPMAARAAWEIGDDSAGQALLDLLAGHPKGHMPPVLRSERGLAAARFAARDTGSPEPLAAAVEEQRASGSPFHLAHGLLDLAEAQRAAGDTSSADAAIDEAALIARRLGCRPLLDRAISLGAAGVVGLPQPGTGGDGVTSPSSASAASTSSLEMPSR